MTASFHSKVGIFTPLRLNNYHVRIAKFIAHRIWTWGGAPSSNPMTNEYETCVLRCERDSY